MTDKEILQQLNRWIQIKDDHPSADYTQALVDFRNLILRQGPYRVDSQSRNG